MTDTDALRRDLLAGLNAARLSHSALSIELGRSKDYIGDFLRGNKDTLGHKEIVAIRARISAALNENPVEPSTSIQPTPDNLGIHIELAAFREALFGLLYTLRVPPVLARSRIDDLLADLRSISEAQRHSPSAESLRIFSGSGERATADPVEPSNDK